MSANGQRALVGTLLLLWASIANSDPPIVAPQLQASPTSLKPVTGAIRISGLKIQIGVSTLKEVQTWLQSGEILQEGDASEHVAWLCYAFDIGSMHAQMWLSSSEMSGGDVIDAIQMARVRASGTNDSACQKLPQISSIPKFDNGVSIGIPKAHLLRLLGRPSKTWQEWISFASERKWRDVHRRQRLIYITSSLFAARIQEGVVSEIAAIESTSD